MATEYLINKVRYYTRLDATRRIFDVWESDKFTLSPPGSGDKKYFSVISSFMEMRINKPLPNNVLLNVYGGVMGTYSTVQSVQGVSYPNYQTDPGITPVPELVPGGSAQIIYSGPASPNYGSKFNLLNFEQTNTFSNALPLAFYRVTFQNASGQEVPSFELDVTFNGAIVASE
jgi:hypothetical protein